MSQYKELANTLKNLTHNDMGFYAAVDEAIAILSSLDAQPVAVYHGRCVIDCGENGHSDVEMLKMIPAGTKLYAAPVAAQPTEQEQSQFFCGVDFADGVLAVSVMRRRPDDVAEMIHSEQIEVAAQPQQAKPLSDVEMNEIYRNTFGLIDSRMVGEQIKFVRAIEAAHGIKEQG